jgi:hypothetical protein
MISENMPHPLSLRLDAGRHAVGVLMHVGDFYLL